MSQPLRKFIPRAPRYVLRPQDEQLLRFAHESNQDRTFTTQFINISTSGVAFTAERDYAPGIGELIKVEFPVPGGDRVAWWARVVRIEEPRASTWWHNSQLMESPDALIIGVEFQNLPEGHYKQIKLGLEHKIAEVIRERRRQMILMTLSYINSHFWRFVLLFGMTVMTVAVLYWLSLPSANYDAERGSPWGQRFKFWPFVIQDDGQ